MKMHITENIPEFGTKRENEERRDGGCAIVYDPDTERYAVGKHHADGFLRLFSGGVEDGEDIVEGILREVTEESGLYDFEHVEVIAEAYTHYINKLKNVNRFGRATCLLVILKSSDLKETKLEEHEKFGLVWVSGEELVKNWIERNGEGDRDHWLYFFDISKESLKKQLCTKQ